MNFGKVIRRVALGVLALTVVPYRIKKDKEANTLEVRSLLWGVKKTPGEEKDHITFSIPGSGLDANPAVETSEEEPEEAPKEEPEEAPEEASFTEVPAGE